MNKRRRYKAKRRRAHAANLQHLRFQMLFRPIALSESDVALLQRMDDLMAEVLGALADEGIRAVRGLPSFPAHVDCDCSSCRPWTT